MADEGVAELFEATQTSQILSTVRCFEGSGEQRDASAVPLKLSSLRGLNCQPRRMLFYAASWACAFWLSEGRVLRHLAKILVRHTTDIAAGKPVIARLGELTMRLFLKHSLKTIDK